MVGPGQESIWPNFLASSLSGAVFKVGGIKVTVIISFLEDFIGNVN